MRWINRMLLLALILSQSCIDPFIPETTRYDSVLFIEGLISNDTSQPQMVRISYAAPLASTEALPGNKNPEPATGAMVSVIDQNGLEFEFPEVSPGQYRASGFYPRIGDSYYLQVSYNGNSFLSDREILRPAPPIDQVIFRHQLERLSENGELYEGYRFYVSTHEESNGPSYYRWDCESTYLFQVPYDATHKWNGATQIVASNRDVKYCWSTKTPKGIFIASTEGLAENRVVDAPLHFVSQYGDALSMRYSLNIKQFSISKSVWQFWSDLSKTVNQNGGMYDTQPYRIQGNVRCVSDENLFVAGIFEVAGYAESRIFLNRPREFDIIPVVCPWDTIGTESLPWYRIPPGSFISYDVASGYYFYSNPPCYDCTLRGGTTQKPAFWEDGN